LVEHGSAVLDSLYVWAMPPAVHNGRVFSFGSGLMCLVDFSEGIARAQQQRHRDDYTSAQLSSRLPAIARAPSSQFSCQIWRTLNGTGSDGRDCPTSATSLSSTVEQGQRPGNVTFGTPNFASSTFDCRKFFSRPGRVSTDVTVPAIRCSAAAMISRPRRLASGPSGPCWALIRP